MARSALLAWVLVGCSAVVAAAAEGPVTRQKDFAAAGITALSVDAGVGSVRIEQTIHVQRDGQRAIFLGKGGARIKQIGARARHELAEMLERPVHLFLHVKVSERWADDPSHYRTIGLDYDP